MEEIDLKEFVMLFWNRKVSIILITVIFMVIGIIYSVGFVTPKYTSSTTLLLATSENSNSKTNTITTSDITLNSKLVSTYSELVKSKNVTRQVITNLGIEETEEDSFDKCVFRIDTLINLILKLKKENKELKEIKRHLNVHKTGIVHIL